MTDMSGVRQGQNSGEGMEHAPVTGEAGVRTIPGGDASPASMVQAASTRFSF